METNEVIAAFGLRYLTAENVEAIEDAMNEEGAKSVVKVFNDMFERPLTTLQRRAIREALQSEDEETVLTVCDKVMGMKLRTNRMKPVI